MEDRIRSQLKDRRPEEVEELNLDNVRASKVEGLDGYEKLKVLSVIHVGLTSLEGFPALPSLERLDLGDNRLRGGVDQLAHCPSLQHISLVGNKIDSTEDLKALSSLPRLTSLELLDCPLTKEGDYRDRVFKMLPALEIIDGFNRSGDEVESDDEEEDEEEEEEEEEESSSDDEPGLSYLQKTINSDDSEDSVEYDPDADTARLEDDEIVSSDDPDTEDGPSSSKRQKLDPNPDPEPDPDSDSD